MAGSCTRERRMPAPLCALLRPEYEHSWILRWGKYLQSRKVGLIACGITREQREIFDSGVRAYVKVRQWSLSLASATAVRQKTLSGEETGFPRKRLPLIHGAGQSGIQS